MREFATVRETTTEQRREHGLLDDLLERARFERADLPTYALARRGIEALLGALLDGHRRFERVDETVLDRLIAEIDGRLSAQVDEFLHHPDVQRLESRWRAVRRLVQHADPRRGVRVEIVNATKDDLDDDFEDAANVVTSGLYRTVYSAEYGTFGGEPYGAIVTDFEFDASLADLRLLQKMAAVGALAHAPVLVNASPRMFGADDHGAVAGILDLPAHFEQPQYERWAAFRKDESARYVGMCLPRVALRDPWVHQGEFDYREVVDGDDGCLWGPASFALAGCCADSFVQFRWCNNIVGPRGGGTVDGLAPQVQLSERREAELARAGFIGLTARKGSDEAAFFSANSCLEGTPEDHVGHQLPYLFIISRVAHYLKVMQRENIGTYKTRDRLQFELSWWLAGYTTRSVANDVEMARYPFKDSSVVVEDVPGVEGWYRYRLQLVPHVKLQGVDLSLSLVGKLDRPRAREHGRSRRV